MKIAEVVEALHNVYPPNTAHDWDRVGLSVGDPNWEVTHVGFAVDPCEITVNEAIERGAQLLITHHPLYLRGTSYVVVDGGKGTWVTKLIRNGVGLLSAHTNADVGAGGTAATFAELLGLSNARPIKPEPDDPLSGIGRVGDLPMTMSVAELAQRVTQVIPPTPTGVVVGGDPDQIVKTVAVSPGSGDSYLDAANEVADVYITADLRHHPATDHLWAGGIPLIGVGHFASEWVVLPKMRDVIAQRGVETYISTLITDPWSVRIA